MCVCVCVRVDKITFHVCLWQPAIVPTDNLKVFDVLILLKTYGSKVIARSTFPDAFVKTERTGG